MTRGTKFIIKWVSTEGIQMCLALPNNTQTPTNRISDQPINIGYDKYCIKITMLTLTHFFLLCILPCQNCPSYKEWNQSLYYLQRIHAILQWPMDNIGNNKILNLDVA